MISIISFFKNEYKQVNTIIILPAMYLYVEPHGHVYQQYDIRIMYQIKFSI